MPIVTTMLIAAVVPKVTEYILDKGADYLVSKGFDLAFNGVGNRKEDFALRLSAILENTINEYEIETPPDGVKEPFYNSSIILNELLKYRFTEEFDSSAMKKLLEDESSKYSPPQESDLNRFLNLLTDNINKDNKLKELNLKYNSQEEIFTISKNLKAGFEEIRVQIEEIKEEIKGRGSVELILDWNKQLDEIDKNIQDFKPRTALERITSLQNRIQEAGIFNKPIEGKIAFIIAQCNAELSDNAIKDETAKNYIKAYSCNPNNIAYLSNAALSYCALNDYKKAEELANKILGLDEYNIHGWLVKSIISGKDSLKYQQVVPELVKKNKSYQLNFTHWLVASQNVFSLKDIVVLSLDFLEIDEKQPKEINHKNKVYWNLLIRLQLMKYYEDNPMQNIHNVRESIPGQNEIRYINSVLKKIISAVRGSEIEFLYKEKEFEYCFTNFLIYGKSEDTVEAEKVYKSINEPFPILTLQMALLYNTQGKEGLRKSIELLTNYKNKTSFDFHLTNVLAYYELGEIDNARLEFKKYLTYIKEVELRSIEEQDVYNIIQYFDFVLRGKIDDIKADLEFVIDNFEFESAELKKLVSLYLSSIYQQEVTRGFRDDIDMVREVVANYNVHLKDIFAVTLFRLGLYEDVVSFVETYIDCSQYSTTIAVYCKALYNGSGNKKKLLDLLKQLRIDNVTSHELLKMETDLRVRLNDWKSVLETTTYGISKFEKSGYFSYYYLVACERNNETVKIEEYIPKLDSISFKDESAIFQVAGVLFRMGHFKLSIDYLYDLVINKGSANAKQQYFMTLIHTPEDVYPNPITVDIDTYVEYAIDKDIHAIHITEHNYKEPNVSVLIGKKIGDTFKVGVYFDNNLQYGKIIAIRNKYSALLNEILKSVSNPMLNMPVKQFSIEGEGPEALKKSLISALGVQGTMRRDWVQEKLSEFYNGKISYALLSRLISDDDLFEMYFALTHKSSNCFRTIPSYLLYTGSANNYVLDVSSILFLFQISQEIEIKKDTKFIISSYVINILQKKMYDVQQNIKSSMNVSVTLNDVVVNSYSEDYHQDKIDFYNEIKSWIDDNCIVENAEESLDVIMNVQGSSIDDILILYLSESAFLASRQNNVLLTLDTAYHQMLGHGSNVMTIDEYFKINYSDNIYLKARQFMLDKRLVGITIDFDLLKFEYERKLSNQDNNFLMCLENLKMSWNKNQSHVLAIVSFLKWLMILPYLKDDEKSRMCQYAFMSILTGADGNIMRTIYREIKDQFRFLPLQELTVLDELRVALTTLNNIRR